LLAVVSGGCAAAFKLSMQREEKGHTLS
jgi:hypothetical protein